MSTRSATHPREETPSEPEARYLAGDVIEQKYRLTHIIGEGGMGSVWLARHLTLDVDVAVKLIRRESATAEASERLLHEARAAARLGHPSICRVYEFGETAFRDPFIVMEVLKGESLGDLLDRKDRLAPLKAVQALLPIASAVSAAHARGIVHRDIKPDNIVLTVDDTGAIVPKLVDFGIAKLRHIEHIPTQDGAPLPHGIARRVTQTGAVVGSPDYMAPEQATGAADIDGRCDVWSLCVVLYEIITGARPFDGDTYHSLVASILMHDPKPTTAHGVGDAELWSIIRRGLAKDPGKRWQDVRAVGQSLARWALGQGADADIAGTSLRVHWLSETDRRPLSEMPPSSDSSPELAPLGDMERARRMHRLDSTLDSGIMSPVVRQRERWGVRAVVGAAALLIVAALVVLVAAPWRDAPPPASAAQAAGPSEEPEGPVVVSPAPASAAATSELSASTPPSAAPSTASTPPRAAWPPRTAKPKASARSSVMPLPSTPGF